MCRGRGGLFIRVVVQLVVPSWLMGMFILLTKDVSKGRQPYQRTGKNTSIVPDLVEHSQLRTNGLLGVVSRVKEINLSHQGQHEDHTGDLFSLPTLLTNRYEMSLSTVYTTILQFSRCSLRKNSSLVEVKTEYKSSFERSFILRN